MICWATFDKGVTQTLALPCVNCLKLFQSGVILAAAHKNVTPFKARVEDGWPVKDGVKKNISMPTESPPPTRILSRGRLLAIQGEGWQDAEVGRKGVRVKKGSEKRKDREEERDTEKIKPRIRARLRGRILLITGVLWSQRNETFPF